MGSGKTTVGRLLARELAAPFVDSDAAVEQRIGMPIRDFFERMGEPKFRDIEEDTLDELTLRQQGVLSTGGGVVLRPINRERLRERCTVVYLKSTPEIIWHRIKHDQRRPLLQVEKPLVRLSELHEQRDGLYQETAHHTILTGRRSPQAVVRDIHALLGDKPAA